MNHVDNDKNSRGVQSVETAALMLEFLTGQQGGVPLKKIAQAVGMSPARAFPYLISLVRSGLVTKDDARGLYLPGELSQQLGMLALHLHRPYDTAEHTLKILNLECGHSAALSVWGNMGPTVVRVEESRYSVYPEIRIGSVMSLEQTSIGQVFSAWMPEEIVREAWEAEYWRREHRAAPKTAMAAFFAKLEAVRQAGCDFKQNVPAPGLSSVSAPVFDLSGSIAYALTLFDESGVIDVSPGGAAQQVLRHHAYFLSAALGLRIDYPTGDLAVTSTR